MLSRRAFLGATGATALLVTTGLDAAASPPVTLFGPGVTPVVLTPASPAAESVAAATELRDLLAAVRGQAIGVQSSTYVPAPGQFAYRLFVAPGVSSFTYAVSPTSVDITGADPWDLRRGVYRFLDQVVGVRWPMPTPTGRIVPSLSSLGVEPLSMTHAPAFGSRTAYPLPKGSTFAYNTAPAVASTAWPWAQWHGARQTLSLHHSFTGLLRKAPYTTDPAWSAIWPFRGATRFIPGPSDNAGWQPRSRRGSPSRRSPSRWSPTSMPIRPCATCR